jgi:hypothetical protein
MDHASFTDQSEMTTLQQLLFLIWGISPKPARAPRILIDR